MSSFFLCLAAWSALALGMDRHHADALGAEGSAQRRHWLQRTGGLGLLLSLWLATRAPADAPDTYSASIAMASWAVALSVAAVVATAVVTWQPQRVPLLGAAALLAGLLAQALGS